MSRSYGWFLVPPHIRSGATSLVRDRERPSLADLHGNAEELVLGGGNDNICLAQRSEVVLLTGHETPVADVAGQPLLSLGEDVCKSPRARRQTRGQLTQRGKFPLRPPVCPRTRNAAAGRPQHRVAHKRRKGKKRIDADPISEIKMD